MRGRTFERVRMRLAAAMLAVSVPALLLPTVAMAKSESIVDWRANLTCAAEHQLHEGILYCTGMGDGRHTFHVVVVDLSASSLRFEAIIPKGASDGHAGIQECRDPNVPAWGGLPAKGCFVPGNPSQYPRIPLSEAVERAREVRGSPGLVAVINADYTDTTYSGHGPEGLLVVRKERLDGVAHCDDDYNAALRPWLGLGETVDPATGLLPATIARLPTDGSRPADWIYTGIGGGPWLVRDGSLDSEAAVCASDYRLSEIDPVKNCYWHEKDTPTPPLVETYAGGSCRVAPHTAAGISSDGRWLFLAVGTGNDGPRALAEFLLNQVGAKDVIKFDGGGSSQLWFAGYSDVTVDPGGEERWLNSFMAVYSGPGKGILLPLAAEPLERVYFQVLDSGERADLTLTVRNTGNFTWSPDDDIVLRQEPFFLNSPLVESLPLSAPVAPSEAATWQLNLGVDGVLYRRYQVYYKGEELGSDMAVIAVALPEGMEDKRQELEEGVQQLINEWKAKGGAELDQLVEQIRKRVEGIVADLISEAEKKVGDALRQLCGSVGLALALPAVALVGRRR